MTDIDALIAEARLQFASNRRFLHSTSFDLLNALTTERAKVAALEAEVERLRGEVAKLSEPDWFWDIHDPEHGAHSAEELADQSGETALVIKVGCAKTLPTCWMAATYHDRSGWSSTRHDTMEEAEAACAARQALGEES